MSLAPKDFAEKVCKVCSKIPHGKLMSYGLLALSAGYPTYARHISGILKTFSEEKKLPWHRVVNSEGRISILDPILKEIQKEMLKQEGISFKENSYYILDFKKYLWLKR